VWFSPRFFLEKIVFSPLDNSVMKLVFATNNPNKLKEVRQLIPPSIQLLSLRDIDCDDDIAETGSTIRENAYIKSRYIYEKFGMNCFADDTGLEVDAIGGRPGVYSARFAGPAGRSEENIKKLLTELKGIDNRKANFRTVISLMIDGKDQAFEGVVNGVITKEEEGQNGFGYDPVFLPDGHDKTFAEMSDAEKNQISHRGIAVRKLAAFITELSAKK
jgi:non-canonical purine NTP pyrophosphatase (RdgB/HAM1 family)